MATLTSSGVNFSDGTVMNGTSLNQIGSYILATPPSNTNLGSFSVNQTIAGSNLRTTTISYDGCSTYIYSSFYTATGASGTWRVLGCGATVGVASMLVVRIS